MKKTTILLIAFVLVLALFTGCRWGRNDETTTTTTAPTTTPTTAPTTMPTTTPTTVPAPMPTDDILPTDEGMDGNGATAGSDGMVGTERNRARRPMNQHY